METNTPKNTVNICNPLFTINAESQSIYNFSGRFQSQILILLYLRLETPGKN